MDLKAPLLACLLLITPPVFGDADLAPKVIQDLQPRQGYVIQDASSGSNEIYLDLGADQGVRAGDILTAFGPDKVIVHPVTGEVVTRVPSRRTILGVTRSLEDTAIVRRLEGAEISAGDPVTRFGGLPARFIDATGSGEPLYQALRQGLGELEWQGYFHQESATAIMRPDELLFVLESNQLRVHFGQSWPVTTYPRPSSSASAAKSSQQVATISPPPVIVPGGSARPIAALPTARGAYPTLEPVAATSTGSLAAAFVSDGRRTLLASADRSRVELTVIEPSTLRELSTLTVPHRNRVLALQWWQPDPTDAPLLAVTTWDGEEVEGMLMRLRGDQLEPLQLNLPYILGTFDLDNDGRQETLLGQSFQRKGFFGRYIRHLKLDGDQLTASNPGLQFPSTFSVLGSVIADLTGDGKSEFAVVQDRKLSVYGPTGRKIYSYDRGVGSGLSMLTYDISPSQDFSPVERIYFEAPPQILRNDSDSPALLLVGARFSQFSAPGIDSGAKESWLTAIAYQGNRFRQRQLSEAVDQPITGLALDTDRILLLGSDNSGGYQGGGQLLALPLPTP